MTLIFLKTRNANKSEPGGLVLKAQIRNARTPDLFAVPVQIPAYVRDGHLVAPHVAIRHKAPAEVSHAHALIVPAHKPALVTTMPAVDLKAQAQRKAQAKKLREGAQSHLAQADEDINRDRLSNTARRARMAAGSIKDAQQRALIAGTMNNIADLIESGEAGQLAGISTRAQVEALDLAARQSVYAWERDTNQPYHGGREIIPELKHVPHAKLPAGEWNVKDRARLVRMGLKTDQDIQAALREYLPLRSERRREDPIKAAERALVGTKPGIDFFPTPPPLAQRMVQLARIQPGERVLEPSAGKGDIADAIRAAGGKVEAVELSPTLRNVLTAKGYALVGEDFETFEPTELYDVIVMNPPWSGGADVRHVRRAYDMLKPGGRLVALMSMHPSFAQDKASVAFRGWMEELGASSEKIPAADFASQWMSGGIRSWLVSVRKPMTKAMFFKAQIKGANTGDLFTQPVQVKGYVREGHTVAAHTEMRHVRHEVPSPNSPKSYPWESASQSHMIFRMSDDELVAAMTEAVSTPRSLPYLDHMRIATNRRRDDLPEEKNAIISAEMARAERQAGRGSAPGSNPIEDKPKPIPIINRAVDSGQESRQDTTANNPVEDKPVENSKFISRLVEIGGKEWSSADGTKHRIYFELAPLLGWEYSTYGTGNISWAKLNGEKVSNSKAKERLGSLEQKKLWFDVKTGAVGTRDVSDEEKNEALSALNTKFWSGEKVADNPGFATLYRRHVA